ncbi:MAG: response regulator transcription factor [Bacteroidia bacterium]|nr:response regulator transcription factor [Bacteroidia bacterium]
MSSQIIEKHIRTLIVDDEAPSRSALRILLQRHFPQILILDEAETVTEGIGKAEALHPDLVFLDMELPDGNAFVFLDSLAHMHLQVVIVSAHSAHALRAFKYATLHYLLKPVELRDLQEAVARVEKQLNAGVPVIPPIPRDSIALPSLEGFKVVAIRDIIYCEADSNYTIFHLVEIGKYTVANTLGSYETSLSDKPFFRIHDKYLVNLQHIKAYHKGRGGSVEMSNKKELDVSTRKRDAFLAKLSEYTRGV